MVFADLLLIIVALAALIFATITDLKIKEIPDWLSYGLIASGLVIRAFHAIIFQEPTYILYGLIALGATFLIGSFLYHIHQWGGGDAKLLMGLGTIFATKPSYLPESIFPFIVNLIIIIILAGAVYGLIWSLVLVIKNFKKFKAEFKRLIRSHLTHHLQFITLIAALALFILSLFTNSTTKILLIFLAIFIVCYFYLFIIMKSVEHLHFYKKISTEKLVEGDWIAEDIKCHDKTIIPNRKTLVKKDIIKIKKSEIKRVLIKDGLPFVPPFLIGTILALVFGNPFF